MAAVLVTIATDLTALLGAATLTPTPSVKRMYVPTFDKQTATGHTLFVLTNGQSITPVTRADDQFTYQLQVAVYAKVTQPEGTEVDALLEYTQQVLDVVRSNKQLGDAVLATADNAASYNPDLLAQNRIFVSVIRLEYTLLRSSN